MNQVLLVVLVAVLAISVLSLTVSYNRFVSQRNLVRESWSQIDVELTRRHDLIPNLVDTVKASATFEVSVLTGVTQARAAAVASAGASPAVRQAPEGALDGAVRGLLAVAEAYPQLKSSANYLSLQVELANTEDRIAAGRRFYNGNVRAYNTRLQSLPSSIVGSMFGFQAAEFFDADASARTVPPAR